MKQKPPEEEDLLNHKLVKNASPYNEANWQLYLFGRQIFSHFEGRGLITAESEASRTHDGRFIKVTDHLIFPHPSVRFI
jgi:hypothetical protein